ncbi:MAG: efflux transporter outer membrane subunit [Planctomycetes bacterium]|nr:efflux transporter outer membrane subunit [Planctomycetota bacterium]
MAHGLPFLLAGCTVGPDYAPPQPALPSAYAAAAGGAGDASSAEVAAVAEPLPRDWWLEFRDPTLALLVEQALVRSPDLRVAAARVREARALQGVALGPQLPEVGANAAATRSRRAEEGSFFPIPRSVQRESSLWEAGFDASYEFDLFGRVERTVEAAGADVAAAEAAADGAALTLVAEVARRYVELRAAQQRLALAGRHLSLQEEDGAVARARAAAGVADSLAADEADAAARATEATLPRLAREVELARHQLATLLALPPAELPGALRDAASALPSPPPIAAGVPAALLAKRPDLRRAERELAAATARVGIATADLYPRLTLNGGLGLESLRIGTLGETGSSTWSVGPALDWPLFQNGRLRQAIAAADARVEQAAARFEQAVIGALVEVEDALSARAREGERRSALAAAKDAAQRALDSSRALFARGLVDSLHVIHAEERLLSTADEEVLAASGELLAAIALAKALGGGG